MLKGQLPLLGLFFLASCITPPSQPPPRAAEQQDLEFDTPNEPKNPPKTRQVRIYFGHPRLEGIVPLRRQILVHPKASERVKQVVDHLTIPPASTEGFPLWPENTHVREIYTLIDGTVVVDFDEGFTSGLFAGATEEELMIVCLVNSILESFPEYKRVWILKHGRVTETFLGHVDIEKPLKHRQHPYVIIPEGNPDNEIIIESL